MKIVWLDINASYSHASLALPALHAQLKATIWETNAQWNVIRGTTKSDYADLTSEFLDSSADLLLGSLWLFTAPFVLPLLVRWKQLNPNLVIVLGGPEFLGDNQLFLTQNSFVDAVFRGEGELFLPQFLPFLSDKQQWSRVDGLCFLSENSYIDGGKAIVSDFSALRYPEESSFYQLGKSFVQLETARGCFNGCAFCCSGGDKPVRNLSIEQIALRLEWLYNNGVKQIRLLDRTFNGNLPRAVALLNLMEQYAGKLSFHLEVHPSLLNEQLRIAFAKLPAGLLHLEAGIQSLQQPVIDACKRSGTVETALEGLSFLFSLSDKMETHTDLIAGLPHYTYSQLIADTTTLIQMQAGEIQLESLKLLPGTALRAQAAALGLKYAPFPPYEVLETPTMSYEELQKSMVLSRLLDSYFNHAMWRELFSELFSENSALLVQLIDWFFDRKLQMHSQKQEVKAVQLFGFLSEYAPYSIATLQAIWLFNGLAQHQLPDLNQVEPNAPYITEHYAHLSHQERSRLRAYTITTKQAAWVVVYNRAISQNSPIKVVSVV